MADSKKPKTKDYVLLGRDHLGFDEDGVQKLYVTGDKVALSEASYEAFKDKFKEPDAPTPEPKKEDAPKVAGAPGAPAV